MTEITYTLVGYFNPNDTWVFANKQASPMSIWQMVIRVPQKVKFIVVSPVSGELWLTNLNNLRRVKLTQDLVITDYLKFNDLDAVKAAYHMTRRN